MRNQAPPFDCEGNLLSPKNYPRDASTAYPFGLRNSTGVISDYKRQRMRPSDMDDEFMGMADYALESVYVLLRTDFESLPSSQSSDGSHHPSHECFIAEIHDGHASSTSGAEINPREVLAHILAKGVVVPHPPALAAFAPPLQGRMRLEQLQARQRELSSSKRSSTTAPN